MMFEYWRHFDEHKKYIVDKNPVSPFIEARCYKGDTIYVNPLVRLSGIFLPLCQKDNGLTEQEQERIENELFHCIAKIDRLQGVCQESFHLLAVQKDIKAGKYGKDVQEWYEALPAERQYILLQGLDRWKYEIIPSRSRYRVLMQCFFTGAQIYIYENEHKVLVYIPEKKTREKARTAEILEKLFLDCLFHVRLFWIWPFGIIGHERNMRIGGMVIY